MCVCVHSDKMCLRPWHAVINVWRTVKREREKGREDERKREGEKEIGRAREREGVRERE